MTNAPSSTAKFFSASRMLGSSTLRSASEIPPNGLMVSCLLCSITAVESPSTKMVPMGCPSNPSWPMAMASETSASTTWGLNSAPSPMVSMAAFSSNPRPIWSRMSVSGIRAPLRPVRHSTFSPSASTLAVIAATSATFTFSTRE